MPRANNLFSYIASFVLLVSNVLGQSLQSDLTGLGVEGVYPGQASYDATRQAFNERFDREPAAIVFPDDASQVAAAIKVANEYGLHVTACSGRHNYVANGLGGNADGVLVVDLRRLNATDASSSAETITIQPGIRLGNVAIALDKVGRAIPQGTCAYVGTGGHASHGGFGLASRNWGLLLDNVVAIDVVLANGTQATASSSVNQDLFWALRGAGSSFGIVTSFVVKTYPAPAVSTIATYDWDFDIQGSKDAIIAYQKFATSGIPQTLGLVFNVFKGSAQGRVAFSLNVAYYDPPSGLNAVLAPFFAALPPPVTTDIFSGTHLEAVAKLAGQPLDTTLAPDAHDTFYVKSLMTPEPAPLTEEQLIPFFTYLANDALTQTELNWFVQFELWGGSNSSISAVPLNATSFGKRDMLFTIQFYARSLSNDPPFPTSGFTLVDAMVSNLVDNAPKNWNYGAYYNYIDDQLPDWQKLYFDGHYSKLKLLKERYDPKDVFKFSHSVELD